MEEAQGERTGAALISSPTCSCRGGERWPARASSAAGEATRRGEGRRAGERGLGRPLLPRPRGQVSLCPFSLFCFSFYLINREGKELFGRLLHLGKIWEVSQ
jgi:hypothetical protein